MRTIPRWCLALVVSITLCLAADDRVAGLRFSDGVSRTTADFAGQYVLFYYHCGHCPSAMGSLGTVAKAVADWIEQNHKPAWLIIVTPDLEPSAIAELLRSKGLTGALGANDPANVETISTSNILRTYVMQPNGTSRMVNYNDPKGALSAAMERKPGVFRVPVTGLTAEPVVTAWWRLERGTAGVLKELVTVAKKKGPVAEQAKLVVDAAQTAFDTAFANAGEGFAAYEALESLAARFDGLDLKPLKTRMAALGKEPKLKEELKARDVWRQCRTMIASARPKEQAAGRDGLAELAKRMPNTTYGKKAASEPAAAVKK